MYGKNLKCLDRGILGQFLLMDYQHIINTYADSSADPDVTAHNVAICFLSFLYRLCVLWAITVEIIFSVLFLLLFKFRDRRLNFRYLKTLTSSSLDWSSITKYGGGR